MPIIAVKQRLVEGRGWWKKVALVSAFVSWALFSIVFNFFLVHKHIIRGVHLCSGDLCNDDGSGGLGDTVGLLVGCVSYTLCTTICESLFCTLLQKRTKDLGQIIFLKLRLKYLFVFFETFNVWLYA